MSTVYVLNKDGKPLMPTTRCGHVRYLLKEKKTRSKQKVKRRMIRNDRQRTQTVSG